MFSFPDRQYDIPKVGNFHVTLPLAIPYRLDATDYVFFNYPSDFPIHGYRVIMESMSNASSHKDDRFRDIGPLEKKVELPQVFFSRGFGSQSSIFVLPIQEGNRMFIGNLIRGATYTIDLQAPMVTAQGHQALQRTGGVV
jgi:hypothetical protein